MTYKRVLPRDLFNEANLFKCVGKLVLMIEDGDIDWMQYHYDGEEFMVWQDESCGSTRVANIQFWTKGLDRNVELVFSRPLNSRDSWPLWANVDGQGDELVFNEDGEFILEEVVEDVE